MVNGTDIDALLNEGNAEAVIAAIRARAEERNRESQVEVPAPPTMPAQEWAARKAWLLDGQPIHGELKDFYFPAVVALRADNQAEYSAKRDLLFKALRTFLGDPPESA
jgi:hypothetical protein